MNASNINIKYQHQTLIPSNAQSSVVNSVPLVLPSIVNTIPSRDQIIDDINKQLAMRQRVAKAVEKRQKQMNEIHQAIFVAFTGIYLIWESTYLAIRFTLETLPPLLTAGARFLIAGIILYMFAYIRNKEKPPSVLHWRSAAIIGAFLILGGNGNVVLAERSVPSGLAALIVATIPIWMVLLEWLWLKTKRPTMIMWTVLVLGFAGVAVLIVPGMLQKGGHIHLLGA